MRFHAFRTPASSNVFKHDVTISVKCKRNIPTSSGNQQHVPEHSARDARALGPDAGLCIFHIWILRPANICDWGNTKWSDTFCVSSRETLMEGA